jgi:transposase-like protein
LTAPADRRKALEILDAAVAAGARAHKVAELLDVGLTTLQRWRRQFASDGDGVDGRKGSTMDQLVNGQQVPPDLIELKSLGFTNLGFLGLLLFDECKK